MKHKLISQRYLGFRKTLILYKFCKQQIKSESFKKVSYLKFWWLTICRNLWEILIIKGEILNACGTLIVTRERFDVLYIKHYALEQSEDTTLIINSFFDDYLAERAIEGIKYLSVTVFIQNEAQIKYFEKELGFKEDPQARNSRYLDSSINTIHLIKQI